MKRIVPVILPALVLTLLAGCTDTAKTAELEAQCAESERLQQVATAQLQLAQEENYDLRMIDKPAVTFYDFYTAGITNIEILNAAKEDASLGYVLSITGNGPDDMFHVLGGEPPYMNTDPAIFPAECGPGILYEVRSVLRLNVDGTTGVWLYAYPMFHSESDNHSALLPLDCTTPYTADQVEQLICPVYVIDGAVNINGAPEHSGAYFIQDAHDGVYNIWSHGNYQSQVTKNMLKWPSPDEHPPFDPTPYQ